MSVANGYVTNIEELSAEFIKYVEQVITYDANAGVFSISTYSMRSASVSILTSKSPLAAEKISGSTFTFDLISGALDIADTITTFATINANSAIFDENMDFLMEMRDNGNRAFTKDAAADIINALGEGYGTALASAVGADIGELTLNMAISIAASNPYVKAVVFVRDVIAQLTGIKDTLKREYEMPTYSDMSLSANRLISDASYSSGSYYYDRTGDLPRYLTNLAQIRILGEQKYEQFYTNGINSWFNDTDKIISGGSHMLFAYIVTFLISGGGAVVFCYQLYQLILWLRFDKVSATIIDVIDNHWHNGALQYRYEIFIDNKKIEIIGPKFEIFNPLLTFFPKARLGETVTVHFDKKKMRIAQIVSTSLIFMLCSFLIMICGFLAVALLGIYAGNR